MSKNRKTFTLLLLIITVFTISYINVREVKAEDFMCKYEGFDDDNDPITFIIKSKGSNGKWNIQYYYWNTLTDKGDFWGTSGDHLSTKFVTYDGNSKYYMDSSTLNSLEKGICPTYFYADSDGNKEWCFDNNGSYCLNECDNTFEKKAQTKISSTGSGAVSDKSSSIKKVLNDYLGDKNITNLSDIDKCNYVKTKAKYIIQINNGVSDNDYIYQSGKNCEKRYEILCNIHKVVRPNENKNITINEFKSILKLNKSNYEAYESGMSDLSKRFDESIKNYCEDICKNQNTQQKKDICENIDEIFEEAAESIIQLKKATLPKVSSNIMSKSEDTCDSILGERTSKGFVKKSVGWLLQKAFNIFKIIAPLLVLGLSIFEFAKAIISQDQDALKKASNIFIKRLIIMAVLFFLPTIIGILLDILGQNTGTCKIG